MSRFRWEATISKFVVQAAWQDTPHISAEAAATMLASFLPNERDARTKGIPSLGAGAIYPVAESDFVCEPFKLPAWYGYCFALDVGWKRTAALWGARDPETDVLYLWSEHYQGEEKPAIHAQAIKARGDWIPGVIDPAARGRQQGDGEKLMEIYTDLGLELTRANNAVSAGIYEVWTRLSTGRLKVFHSLTNLLMEIRIYRRDEKGAIVKENDHLMDCCLIGETQVLTDRGLVPIRDLVGTEGRVMTRSGAWARWSGVRMTRRNAKVIRLFFHGGEVVCTPDHRFLTPDGWVRADCMEGKLCYNGVTQSIQRKSWTPLRSLRQRAKSFWERATTCAESIFNVTGFGFIEKFGGMQTVGPFRAGSMFTTATTTGRTTLRRISYCFSKPIIYDTITSASVNLFRAKRWTPPQNGTRQTPAPSGTSVITPMSLIDFIDELRGPAIGAALNTRRSTTERAGFVRALVGRAIGSRAALTTYNVAAWLAAGCSWSIATFRSPFARESALVRCVAIQDWPDEDVYCMDVPGVSAFVVEGGMVVHNCRYLVMSGIDKAKQTPVPLVAAGRVKHVSSYDPMSDYFKVGT